jgi:hypothetical protein
MLYDYLSCCRLQFNIRAGIMFLLTEILSSLLLLPMIFEF